MKGKSRKREGEGHRGLQAPLVEEVDLLLASCYGDRVRPAEGEGLLDALVRTILSQNTSDVNSARAFRSLKDRFPDWEAAMRAPAEELEKAIAVGGISRVKSRRIREVLTLLAEREGTPRLDFLGDLPPEEAMDFLTSLPGVGRKTASVVLLFHLGYPFFPVDTHVMRVGKRLGVIPPDLSPLEAHLLMDRLVPDDIKYRLHLNMVTHGRRICRARSPRCTSCCLERVCLRVGVEEKGEE